MVHQVLKGLIGCFLAITAASVFSLFLIQGQKQGQQKDQVRPMVTNAKPGADFKLAHPIKAFPPGVEIQNEKGEFVGCMGNDEFSVSEKFCTTEK